jgi:hypothetical protein
VGRSLPPKRRSNAALFVLLGVAAIAIVVVGILLVGRGGGTSSPQAVVPSASGELSALVATEVEIARRRLASGDYEEALRRAERALKFDPRDEAALKVQKDARAIKERVDEALAGIKAAKSADAGAAGAALWKLLEVAPDNAAAAELIPALDGTYKSRAEEARRLMAQARGSAEKTQAQRLPAFAEGQSLSTAAESAFRASRFAESARDFMRARARYEAADRLSH